MTATEARSHEPRLARIAATIGDPTRALTLARLLDGRYYTAKELAQHAGVTAATMSGHLKLLADEQLVRVRAQGRHRYVGLADGNVAHALEALLRVADGRAPEAIRWNQPSMQPLRCARSCYGHLAGELGVKLYDALFARGWVRAAPAGGGFSLSAAGIAGFAALGIAVDGGVKASASARPSSAVRARRELYSCLDWSERRDHFAGPVAVQLLAQFIEKRWLVRVENSRALTLTPRGRQMLVDQLMAA